MTVDLRLGDCLEVLPTLADCSIDAVVTDPPAGIAFMGKEWDHDKGGRAAWIAWMAQIAAECLRVVKPGGHALVWALPRTSHWTATAWEDAGWEVRDRIAHVFGSGFPKSLDVSKAIDKAAGVEREVVSSYVARGFSDISPTDDGRNQWAAGEVTDKIAHITAPDTDLARQWEGWGTALKPAVEDWWLLRKPLIGTVAQNVTEWGTGAINVGACRIPTNGDDPNKRRDTGGYASGKSDAVVPNAPYNKTRDATLTSGRWPANLIHDGSDEVVGLFPQTGISKGGYRGKGNHGDDGWGMMDDPLKTPTGFGDTGSAARFFYCAKASKADRDEGLDDMPERYSSSMPGRRDSDDASWDTGNDVTTRFVTARHNFHPTVKPTALMRYLCRLITPPGGIVLDPFMGSGSTGKGAVLEGFSFIGIEQEAEYVEIAQLRIAKAQEQMHLLTEPTHDALCLPQVT